MKPPNIFPLCVREPIATAIRIFGEPEIDGQDCFPAERLGGEPVPVRDWRHAKFGFMRPINRGFIRAASVGIFVRYRPSSGAVWCVKLANAARDHRTRLGAVQTAEGLQGALSALGPPTAQHPHRLATLIDVYWWLQDDISYQVNVFRTDYDDIVHSWKAGEIHELRIFASELAPPWEESLSHRPRSGA